MSDSQEIKFEPISASADGTRNAYSRRCEAVGQVMNYAACLWRQGVLSKPDIRTPADWSACGEAARCGRCNALQMRQEEELKGHAIYFVDRHSRHQPIKTDSRAWLMPDYASKDDTPRRSAPAPVVATPRPAPRPASVLDAMGSVGGYADAINAMTEPTPAVVPSASPAPTAAAPAPRPASSLPRVDMLPGESPLAYARRLRAISQGAAA